MDQKYTCPNCGQHILLADQPPGASVQCPSCQKFFALAQNLGYPVSPRSPWPWLIGIGGVVAVVFAVLATLYFTRGKQETQQTVYSSTSSSSKSSSTGTSGIKPNSGATKSAALKNLDDWIADLGAD